MDRKNFLQSSLPLLASAGSIFKDSRVEPETKYPPYLKKGDTIGITCPSGHISVEEVQPCVTKLQEWGFKVVLGKTVGATDFTFAGSDDLRARDLQSMLDDHSIDAIMLGRGGYGAVRMIDKIDFSKFKKRPKWIMGFSDATVFHLHLGNLGIPSIHCKMCNSFPDDPATETPEQADSIDSIRRCLIGNKMEYSVSTESKNRPGTATGKLVGGNLSIIQLMCGSKSAIQTDNRILFIEDVGEYMYKLDGMLWNLLRSNKLTRLKGLIIGGFKIKEDDPGEEFGLTLYDIVMEKVKQFSYPVCFDFPVGHIKVNYALRCGIIHRLEVSANHAKLISLH